MSHLAGSGSCFFGFLHSGVPTSQWGSGALCSGPHGCQQKLHWEGSQGKTCIIDTAWGVKSHLFFGAFIPKQRFYSEITLPLSTDSYPTQVQTTSGGRVTAVPFWYQIQLDPDVSVSTLSRNSHWKQAAAVLQDPLQVQAGDWIRLAVKLHKSTISISAHLDNAPVQMD